MIKRLIEHVNRSTARKARAQLEPFLTEGEDVLLFEVGDIVVGNARHDLFDEAQAAHLAPTDRALYVTVAGGSTLRIAYSDIVVVTATRELTTIELAGGETLQLRTLGTGLADVVRERVAMQA